MTIGSSVRMVPHISLLLALVLGGSPCCPGVLDSRQAISTAVQTPGEQQAGSLRSALDQVSQEVIETDEVRIEKLDIGKAAVGRNDFAAAVKNKTARAFTLGLDIRADPGLWLSAWQKQFVFQIGPGQETRIEAVYEFLRLSPEASLRIRFGIPSIKSGGQIDIEDFFFSGKYMVGGGNPAVDYRLDAFEEHRSKHFEVYCWKGSLCAKEIDKIIETREAGFGAISELLAVHYTGNIRLVFFPDEETKKKETGHTGAGWAFSNIIIEVYNETTKLDPYHELAHILSGQIGEPPALFNEGFAVYISEKLGADALRYLGSPGKKVDDVTRALLAKGALIPLDELLSFTDIGPEESKPPISYPEAASFVKYLLDSQGPERFRRAFRELHNSGDAEMLRKNKEALSVIYGKAFSQVQGQWLNSLNQ